MRLDSGNNDFSVQIFPATGAGGGLSTSSASALDLSSLLNANSPWTLTLFDAQTGVTSRYGFTMSTPGFTADHLRPITLDVLSGAVISSTPTFNFMQDAPVDPSNANTFAFAGIFGDLGSTVFSPPLLVGDTSWTPDGPLPPDTYSLTVQKLIDNADQSLLSVGAPVLINGDDVLGDFSHTLTFRSAAQAFNLVVVPGPGAAGLLAIGGLVAARRRRA